MEYYMLQFVFAKRVFCSSIICTFERRKIAMIKYAKMNYIANCLFYDAVESGDDRLTAAEKVVSIADSYEGIDRIVIIFTITVKLMHLKIELTSNLLNYAISAVQEFQTIPKEELDELIQREDYIRDMEIVNRRIIRDLRNRYHVDILNDDAEEGE